VMEFVPPYSNLQFSTNSRVTPLVVDVTVENEVLIK
jgi:hypothetical protein